MFWEAACDDAISEMSFPDLMMEVAHLIVVQVPPLYLSTCVHI